MIRKTGSARWSGGLKEGQGHVSTESGVLDDKPYGFKHRFEGEPGTNPEELIGAAHAACFSMALSGVLERAETKADDISTTATVSLEKQDGGFAITKVHLDVTAKVPGASAEDFQKAATEAKENCPVSKVLNADITMEAKLA